MIHNKSHPKFLPLVAQVLRPVKKYYYQCTEETQRAIKNLSLVLLFTVTVCGAVFCSQHLPILLRRKLSPVPSGVYHYWILLLPD